MKPSKTKQKAALIEVRHGNDELQERLRLIDATLDEIIATLRTNINRVHALIKAIDDKEKAKTKAK